ncbi:hypothetical protein [Ktedonobacter robiniae]|uniref:Terminase large subunit gp17-like C-terminal domain-containing protein n=1 Tax=Ktedonobacter robiniae TaxID=2778365 RepID=A0ABQ3UXK7_9CHLR|nr:hypothetical protein [Ktedonobacter robiniae]GHO57420.1 hypothetical protein KSB_58950 [Ktedonobacter robiniae]
MSKRQQQHLILPPWPERPGLGWFAREILGKPLYPYQELVGDAILESVLEGRGDTFTVMFARQMGKNQLSATLEAYLLFCMQEGSIVKAAPTYKPQTINSRQRLLSLLDNPFMRNRVWKHFGYTIGMAPRREQVPYQTGPRVMFFSAGPGASIVGATASLLLEIDEAQSIDPNKYDTDLRPMASTTNATTVLYGTAWSEETLLARMRAHNLELERQDGRQRHFAYDWRTLAAINDHYKRYVESEIKRLGEDHISIRTQYRLLPILGSGYLLNDLQVSLLRGQHTWEATPDPTEGFYVAGLDIAGEQHARPGQPAGKHDSTILTIGRVTINDLGLPELRIVRHYDWTGMKYTDQYAAVSRILQEWNVRRTVVDKTGLGEGLASLLSTRLGTERIRSFHFTRASKSQLTYHLLGLINAGRVSIYRQEGSPNATYQQCWHQLRHARYEVPAEGLMNMYVDESDGHDDYLMSLALCCEALRDHNMPSSPSSIIPPPQGYDDGRY